jgi:predicted outer membrane repeat protein
VGSATTGTAITNLTISNGNSNSGGGGINNAGTLSVTGCTFSNNSASEGGGIYSVGPLMVSGSTFAGNFGTHGGGGIATYTDTLTVINSSFTGNSSGNYGGGIYSIGTLTLTGSTFSGNSAIYDGGGLDATNGTVTDSTFYGNSAAAGGGIYSQGTLTVTSSTISGNTANSSPGLGGGIFNQSTLTLSNSILSGNSTTSSGGSGAGIFGNGGQIVNANHNVFYNNIDSGSSEDDCADTCTNNNAISGDPKLLPLGNYGGTMQTMLPQPGSAAICAGLAANVPVGVTTDQRGKPNTTSYGSTTCIDAGAVQTKYALNFTAQQPSNVVAHATMSPSPVVTVLESGSTFTAGSATVSLSDTDSDLGASATISASTVSGVATFSNLNLTHPATGDTLTAALALNTSLNATALSSSFNISIISQSITFVPTITSYSFSAGSFAVSATATSGLPVHFASTTGGVCSASGTTVTILAVGTCTIQATQTGNTDYSAAAPVAVNFTINQATQAISFTPASPVTFGVSPITLSATGGASGITVSFSVVSGPGTISGSTLTVTGAGTIVVAANQAGNTNYAAATQVTVSIVVNKATQTITFTPASPVTFGVSPITLSATGGASGNTVSFSVVSGPGTVSGSTLTVTGAGTIVVAANQAGNTNYAAAIQVTHSVVVNQASQTISFTAPTSPVVYGVSPITLSATGEASSNAVVFSVVSGPGTVSGSTLTVTGAGTVVVAANQAGNTNYAAATQVTHSVVVAQALPAIAVVSSGNPALTQSAVTFTATLSSAASTPTGTIAFEDGATVLGSGTLAAGVATFTTSSLAVGTHTMTAVYSGDVNFAAATSASLTQTIQDFSLIISTSSGSTGTVTQSVAPGGTAAYTFNMTPDGGTVFPAEVDFTVTGLPAGATATFTPPSIAAGSGPTTITLTVNMPQQTGMLAPDRKPGIEPLGRRLAPIALGMLLLPFAGKMRRSGKRLGRIFLLLLLLASAGAVMGLSGCGGDNGFFTQAPQSYTLTITASSGGLQRSTNVTLNLQ